MPPINQQSSRAAYVTAVTVFAILFVTATVFAFYFNAQAQKTTDELTHLREQYAKVIAPVALTNNPDLQTLTAVRDAQNSGFARNDTQMTVALGQVKRTAGVIVGAPADDLNTALGATAAAQKAIDDDNAALAKAVNGTNDQAVKLPQGNLLGALGTLMTAYGSAQGQIQTLQGQLTQANSDAEASKKQLADVTAAEKSATEAAVADAAKSRQDAADQIAANSKSVDDAKAAFDAQAKAFADKQQASETASAALQAQYTKSQGDVKAALDKLELYRGNGAADAAIRQADGKIIRLPGDNIAFINLGQGQQISPGLTFEVYDKATGVPVTTDTNSDNLPVGKASIEVLRVGATSSECRITHLEPGQNLVEGDIIANLVYDPNTKNNFFVFGKFDLDQNGVATSDDTDIIKRLIGQWGGRVQGVENTDTDFVVIGKEPGLPTFSADELQDPINKKKYDDAVADLNGYQDVINKAKDLHIPILNQNRFLYYTGYYDLAKR